MQYRVNYNLPWLKGAKSGKTSTRQFRGKTDGNNCGTSESVTTSTLPSLKSEMIQSELHGDMQRVAEMTIPESEKIQ